ncbi:hypothetical protein [Candidatus Uabimicrobium sp. HlEnr_7]|uniref:hypothetical protein n=1 Tax=Candidatus Uabimicrobium helgolandensis TaxID=3095367 RepID=UPI003556981E
MDVVELGVDVVHAVVTHKAIIQVVVEPAAVVTLVAILAETPVAILAMTMVTVVKLTLAALTSKLAISKVQNQQYCWFCSTSNSS